MAQVFAACSVGSKGGSKCHYRDLALYVGKPCGPLAVLEETWTGEREVPVSLGKSVEAYMEELRDKLETAAKFAENHAEGA